MHLIQKPAQYLALHSEEQKAKWDFAKQILRLDKNDLLLDIGSGPKAWWQDWHKNTLALDPFFKPPGKKRVRAQAQYLPFKSKSVDHSVAITSLHLAGPLSLALAEIARVTKKSCLISMMSRSLDIQPVIKNTFNIVNISKCNQDTFYLLTPKDEPPVHKDNFL